MTNDLLNFINQSYETKITVAKRQAILRKALIISNEKTNKNFRIEMDDTLEQIKKEKMTNLLKKLLLYITT